MQSSINTQATGAKRVPLDYFLGLKSGEKAYFFLGNFDHTEIEWTHDHVEYDLVFGAAQIVGGPALPCHSFILNRGMVANEDTGLSASQDLDFSTQQTDFMFELGLPDITGSVYFSKPLPSQLPKRWDPNGKSPYWKTSFKNEEKDLINRLTDDLLNMGFEKGRMFYGFDEHILSNWETAWEKQGCAFSLQILKQKKGLFKSPNFRVLVEDKSHRPLPYWGTTLVNKNCSSIASVIDAIRQGVDLVWARAQSHQPSGTKL